MTIEVAQKSRPWKNGPKLWRINLGNPRRLRYRRNSSIPANDVSPFDSYLSFKSALTRDFKSDLLNRTGSGLLVC